MARSVYHDDSLTPDGTYDSFLREASRISCGSLRAVRARLHPGARLLDGRFELGRVLGSGATGVVYAARDHHRLCAVAIKTLRAATLDALHCLRAEFLTLHDLAHPNLVSLGELFDDDGCWFFSMELVEGVHFFQHVRPAGVLDLSRLRGAIAQLAAALSFLHAAGKVHRDVKPTNVLCSDTRVVLLDFGLAADAGDRLRVGTLPYMAPEQHAGEHTGPAADWYAVGVMLWAALAGRLPFSGDDRELAAHKHRGGPPLDAPPDLAALVAVLLDPDPANRPSGREITERLGGSPPRHVPATPFVGRDRELAALDAAWSVAQRGAATALVYGASGIGKSALLAQFADKLQARGAIALVGRCHERVTMPYKAIHGIGAALAAHLRDDHAARAAVADARDLGLLPPVFPSLAEVAALAGAEPVAETVRDPQQLRIRVFDAFAALIARLAGHAPLVLMIDDLQWADRDGLALLRHVVAAAPARVLVVAAMRDGEIDPAAAWLAAGARIPVDGLAPDDAEQLARRFGGGGAAGLIARESTGHPLHIAELARFWNDGGEATALRLDDAIAGRVRNLPVDHARVLSMTVVAGALPQAVIADAVGLDGGVWWSALAALRASRLVRTHGPRGTDLLEPYHDRVREAVAARLAPEVIIDGHTCLAAALEDRGLGADHPDLLAYHLEGAGRPTAAAHWTALAADRAASSLAFDRAAELYERALALAAPAPDHEVSLRTRLGDALANAGRGAPAAAAYLAGAEVVAGDEALELRRRAAEQLVRSGHLDQGLAVIDDVLRAVGLPTVSRRRWRVATLLIQRALLRIRRWRGPARRRGSGDDRRRLACCWSAVVSLAMASPIRMAEYQARHLRLAFAAREPLHIALAMSLEAAAGALCGPPARRAHALLEEARSWAEQVDDRRTEPYLAVAEGVIAGLCGQWSRSVDRCDAAERMFRDDCVGVTWEIGSARQIAMSCLVLVGRFNELRHRLTGALDDAERRGDLYATTQYQTLLPILCLVDDQPATARDVLARARTALPRHDVTMLHWQVLQTSAWAELYIGAPAKAVALLDQHMPAIQRAFLLRMHQVQWHSTYTRTAAWLGALGEGAREPARLRSAIRATCKSLGSDPISRPVLLLVNAELAVLRGDLDAAVHAYLGAADAFDAAGLTLFAWAARWRRGELLGGDTGRALVAQVRAALSAEGCVRPDRVVAMLVPVAANARALDAR